MNKNDKLRVIDEKFVKIYKHAFKNSPYLRLKYESAGLSFNSVTGIKDLKKIPILTRDEIIENMEGILITKKSYNISIGSTGGTTGKPMSFYRDNNLPYESFYSFYLKKWGLYPHESSVYIWRMKKTKLFNKILNILFWYPTRKLKFDGTKINKPLAKKIISSLNKYKPPLIQGYAGCIYQLSKIMEDEKYSLNYKPKAIWVTAAPLSFSERKKISYIFNSNVYNEYGSGEIPWIAFQKDPNEDLLHVNNYSRSLEIINQDETKLGEVVLTDFFDFSFPKIRYMNGDQARFFSASTTYNTIIQPVMGRKSDYLLVPKMGKIDGSFLTTIFNDFPESIKGFQFIQDKLDEVKLLVIPNHNDINSKSKINIVVEDLNKYLSYNIKISVILVEELIVDRGKIKYVIRSKEIK
jgi:phenylacetate-CoA ligase